MLDFHTLKIFGKRLRSALAAGVVLLFAGVLVSASLAAERPDPDLMGTGTADHYSFKVLKEDIESGSELTKACLGCHNLAAKQVHDSIHWTWTFQNLRTNQHQGKKALVNNTLLGISSNEPYCARCHISNEWTESAFDFKAAEQVDCLACHDTTGTYASKKMHLLRAKCSACHVEIDKTKAREVVQRPDYAELGRLVGKPSIKTCGSCHFYSDGGDGIKHGDLDTSLITASRDLDVHMAKDGKGYTCTSCHQTKGHQTEGSRYAPGSKDLRGVDVAEGSRATCESCHGLLPHSSDANTKLNDHVDRIACQTCHIPALARGGRPTKIYWDWSTAGRLNDAGKEIVEKDDRQRIVYSTQRGSSQWAENVAPEYIWFNGRVEHLTLDDKIDPGKTVQLNILGGSPDDPQSRIWPVKTLRGKQPIDAKSSTLVVARLFGKTDDAFWEAYDWKKAIETGMKAAGRDFSGTIGFVETEMRIPINHMVAPAKKALSCEDCHSREGRMANVPGIFMPGRGSSLFVDLFGLLLVCFAAAGVLAHAALRVSMKFRNNRKA